MKAKTSHHNYYSSDNENSSKHLKVLIEESVKKFLAQNHKLFRDYDENSKNCKNMGFTLKSVEITWPGQGNPHQFEFNEET
uniref:Uncharacterized protein n=1 Tax=Romanomermis culicivorax TaxID=13658 RepID=A0A915IJB7_ROMCU